MSGADTAERLIRGGSFDPLRLHKAALKLTTPQAIDEFYEALAILSADQRAQIKTGIAVYLPHA